MSVFLIKQINTLLEKIEREKELQFIRIYIISYQLIRYRTVMSLKVVSRRFSPVIVLSLPAIFQ